MATQRGKFPPNRVETMRERAGLSMDELGRLVGCEGSTINKLEKSQRALSKKWLYPIAAALDCLPHELLLGEAAETQRVIDLYQGLSEPGKAAAFTMLDAIAHRERERG